MSLVRASTNDLFGCGVMSFCDGSLFLFLCVVFFSLSFFRFSLIVFASSWAIFLSKLFQVFIDCFCFLLGLERKVGEKRTGQVAL